MAVLIQSTHAPIQFSISTQNKLFAVPHPIPGKCRAPKVVKYLKIIETQKWLHHLYREYSALVNDLLV